LSLTKVSTSTSSHKSALLDRKIEETAAGLPKYYTELLRFVAKDNAAIIVEYISAMKSEVNLSDNYRRDLIELLSRFSKYNNDRSFKELMRDDIITFLEGYRKTEAADPMHKWIGTYNIYRMHLHRFFKWLYYPHLEPDKRPKPTIFENIPKLKRKEKSTYGPSKTTFYF
jgi:hypothetical protein